MLHILALSTHLKTKLNAFFRETSFIYFNPQRNEGKTCSANQLFWLVQSPHTPASCSATSDLSRLCECVESKSSFEVHTAIRWSCMADYFFQWRTFHRPVDMWQSSSNFMATKKANQDERETKKMPLAKLSRLCLLLSLSTGRAWVTLTKVNRLGSEMSLKMKSCFWCPKSYASRLRK